jgi:hypothetical protein
LATARKKAAVVDRATLTLLDVPKGETQTRVTAVRQGFATLDFEAGPRLVAMDFLPDCQPGDVLALQPRGRSVRIAVDVAATAKAHAKLIRLWQLIAPGHLP